MCCRGISCASLIDDELRDIKLERFSSPFPPFPCDLLMARSYRIPTRSRCQVDRNGCLQVQAGPHPTIIARAKSELAFSLGSRGAPPSRSLSVDKFRPLHQFVSIPGYSQTKLRCCRASSLRVLRPWINRQRPARKKSVTCFVIMERPSARLQSRRTESNCRPVNFCRSSERNSRCPRSMTKGTNFPAAHRHRETRWFSSTTSTASTSERLKQ